MPRRFKALIATLCVLLPCVANGEELELICTGTSHFYENGFGSKDNTNIKGYRLAYIDKNKNTLRTETFIGEGSAKLKTSNQSYWAEYILNKEHINGHITKETVNIDRYTGEVTYMFYVNVDNKEAMYIHFEGKCQKAKKLF